MRIRLAPQARTDLDEIWLYVARKSDSPETATRHIDSIARGFGVLAKFPFIGKPLESSTRPGVRTLAVRNYVAFYRPGETEVRILRIIHGARDAYAVFAEERDSPRLRIPVRRNATHIGYLRKQKLIPRDGVPDVG